MQPTILVSWARRSALAIAGGLSLWMVGGCTRGPQGIEALTTAPNPIVRSLANAARSGDKQSQLTLGILLEEGVVAPRDWPTALYLYRQAGQSRGGTLWIYTPNVGSKGGQVMPYDSGPAEPGLPEARERYRALRKRMR